MALSYHPEVPKDLTALHQRAATGDHTVLEHPGAATAIRMVSDKNPDHPIYTSALYSLAGSKNLSPEGFNKVISHPQVGTLHGNVWEGNTGHVPYPTSNGRTPLHALAMNPAVNTADMHKQIQAHPHANENEDFSSWSHTPNTISQERFGQLHKSELNMAKSEINRKEIATTLLSSLKNVLAKREKEIQDLQAKEAKGHEKLEKSGKNDGNGGKVTGLAKEAMADTGVLPELAKEAMSQVPTAKQFCLDCGSEKLEPLGVHRGQDHSMCKACGSIDAKPILNKKTPSDISEGTMHDLKDQYNGDKEKAYATAWAIHNKKKNKRHHTDEKKSELEKAALGSKGITPGGPSVEQARMAVGGPQAKPAGLPNPFNQGSALGKGEFNDGAGTMGKPHKEIPATDVAIDKANPEAKKAEPKNSKEIKAEGSGGAISKGKLVKDEGGFAAMEARASKQLAPKPAAVANQPQPAGIIPTARENFNAKQGITSLATIRQRWHAKGKMDTNDIVAAAKKIVANAPKLSQATNNLSDATSGMPKASIPGPQMKLAQGPARGKFEASGTGQRQGMAPVEAAANQVAKAEIPAAPKPPSAGGVAKPPMSNKASTPKINVPKL